MSFIAGTFALFQTLMPLAGWLFVHTIIGIFGFLEPAIPWIALVLLVYIGGKMLLEKEDDDSASYSGIDVSSFDYTVDGFKGNIPGWETFKVEDKKGEQNVRLYAVSNSNTVLFPGEISVDTPFDSEGASIDNILITLVID